jgi:hypothetical protein
LVRSPASVIRRGVSFSASGDFQAKTRGITKADLMEAAGCNLKAYMLAELNRAVELAVEYRG